MFRFVSYHRNISLCRCKYRQIQRECQFERLLVANVLDEGRIFNLYLQTEVQKPLRTKGPHLCLLFPDQNWNISSWGLKYIWTNEWTSSLKLAEREDSPFLAPSTTQPSTHLSDHFGRKPWESHRDFMLPWWAVSAISLPQWSLFGGLWQGRGT